MIPQSQITAPTQTKQMINMAPGLDKGQFGQSMHQFEAITTSDPAQPADLRLLWRPCEQEMTHDSILNTFIMFLVGFKNSKQLQDIIVAVYIQKTHATANSFTE